LLGFVELLLSAAVLQCWGAAVHWVNCVTWVRWVIWV